MKTLLTVTVFLSLLPLPALAINKCTGADGKVTYTDESCPANSKAKDKLAEMPPPRPEDVQRAQDEAARIKDEVRRTDERRAEEREKRARAEHEAALDRERKELIELERRKVEALEAQARAAASAPAAAPVIVVREHQPHRPALPPPTNQSQPREHKKTEIFGPRLPAR